MEWTRLDGESEEHLLMRLVAQKDQIGTWDDIARIMNELTGQSYGECKYRKSYKAFQKMYDANLDILTDFDAYSDSIMDQKRELEIAKIQYRDERNAWNKQNYLDARVEQKLDYLENVIKEIGRIQFSGGSITSFKNDETDLLVILSDMHIGQTFESVFGRYNSDIAKDRLNQYLNNIFEIQKRHKAKNVYVSVQGDLISGSIHKSIAITNRENVIDQIKLAVEYITSFVFELSNKFENVYIANTSGNHSRLDRKDDALHDERFDDLIGWMIDKLTCHKNNIHFVQNNIDIGISIMNIRGKEYCGVHGDYDAFSKSGVSNLCMMLGHIPYAVTFGHLHTCTVDNIQGVKAIRGGCFSGVGDSYTIEKRLKGQPSQMVCVCSDKGIDCFYPVELN